MLATGSEPMVEALLAKKVSKPVETLEEVYG